MGLQWVGPTFPTLTLGAITQLSSPFKTFTLAFDDAKGDDTADVFATNFGRLAGFAYEAASDPVGFALAFPTDFSAGVTYESGSGDYAEWLERLDPEETLGVADVVGVYGGKVTKTTEGAGHVMVVSFKPIGVGQHAGREEEEPLRKSGFLGADPGENPGHVSKWGLHPAERSPGRNRGRGLSRNNLCGSVEAGSGRGVG